MRRGQNVLKSHLRFHLGSRREKKKSAQRRHVALGRHEFLLLRLAPFSAIFVAGFEKKCLRKQDHLYRYGGDEFVLIIPGVDKKMACVIGERILKTVKNREFKIDETGELFKITVSIGIAIFPDNGKSRHDILALADQMMYLAKSSGRGQVKMALEILERR